MPQSAFGQQYYVRVGGGWNFPFLAQTIAGDGTLYSGTFFLTQNTVGARRSQFALQRASFGAGGVFNLAGGINLSEHAAIELGAQIGFLNPEYVYNSEESDMYGGESYYTVEVHAERPVNLCPALVLHSNGRRFNAYLRAGPVLPVNTKRTLNITEQYNSSSSFGSYHVRAKMLEESKPAIGAGAALGTSFSVQPHLSIFVECNITALQMYIRQRTYTGFTYNGQDILDAIPDVERTILYEEDGEDRGPTATTSPVRPTYPVPYSALGIVAGLSVGW